MRAIDIVRGLPVVAEPGDTLEHTARLMASNHVDAVVVVEGHRPAGIVTERDLVVRGLARGLPVDARVDAVMTTDPITLDAGTDAAEAYFTLCRRALHRLPLVDDGRLVGVLTLDDYLDAPPELVQLVHRVTGEGTPPLLPVIP